MFFTNSSEVTAVIAKPGALGERRFLKVVNDPIHFSKGFIQTEDGEIRHCSHVEEVRVLIGPKETTVDLLSWTLTDDRDWILAGDIETFYYQSMHSYINEKPSIFHGECFNNTKDKVMSRRELIKLFLNYPSYVIAVWQHTETKDYWASYIPKENIKRLKLKDKKNEHKTGR